MGGKHPYIFFIQKMRHAVWRGPVVEKSPLLRSFLNPCIIISISIKDNMLMVFDGLSDHFM